MPTSIDLKKLSIWLAIKEICVQEHPTKKSDCGLFVRAIASRLGVVIGPGRADQIVDFVRTDSRWTLLEDYKSAMIEANSGKFVVAGIKSTEQHTRNAATKALIPYVSDSGHVAVVISGPAGRKGFPNVYAGSVGSVSARVAGGSIRDTFLASDLEDGRVTYSSTWSFIGMV